MSENLIKTVNEVVWLREKVIELRDNYNKAYAEFIEKHTNVISEKTDAESALYEAETMLRQLATNEYEKTGIKEPVTGVKIKIMKELEYKPEEALKWAVEHKLAIKLDAKTFEKIASSTVLDFVQIKEIPQATLARELKPLQKATE